MKKHYIHINNLNNNYARQAITPKIGNCYYSNSNNFISATSTINKSYKHKNNILTTNKNFKNLNNNSNEYILGNDNFHNKNISLNNYSNLLNAINKQNTHIKKNENKDEYKSQYQNTHKKNVSLKKTQNEIKMIEIKLTSEIIKNKIKQLNDISNDNKYKNRRIINNAYMGSDNSKKYKDNDIIINKPNYNKYYLINKRLKERKIYKIRKIKNNNTDSKKSLIRKRNINLNEKERFDIDTHTFYQIKNTKKISNNNSFINKNIKLNSEQNKYKGFHNPHLFEADSERNIKSKIDQILEPKQKIKPINMKNILDYSNIKKKFGLSLSPSYLSKNTFKDNLNNYNNNYNNDVRDKKFFENNKRKNYNDNINNNEYKSESLNDKFLIYKKEEQDKNNDLPQGLFDNYCINNYNIKNINNTNIYNSIDKQNNSIEKKEEGTILNEEKNKIIFSNNQNINPLKKSFDNQKENKVIDLAFITNNNSKRNKMKQNNKNNSIINTVNFSFNPIKVIYDKEIFIPSNSNNEIKNFNAISNDKFDDKKANNKSNKLNDNKKINNNQINSNNIIINEKNNNIMENHNETNKSKANTMPIIKEKKEINIIKDNKNLEEKAEKKDKYLLIEPKKLEEKEMILNKTVENNEKEKIEDNKKIQDKKKVIFDEIKTIIKYYQNDYIKKSFIFSDNNFKKIKHNYLPTKEHIQKLKKQGKPQSILIVKQDENKIKNDKLNLALCKLNELISEEKENENINKKQENKIDNNNNKIPFIKKNINFIKTIEENYKKGINYKCLSKREMKLLKKKKKNMCYKYQNNPQNFFSEKLCDNMIKSFDFNMDDSDIMKINKKGLIKKKLGDIKIENEIEDKLSNSFREEKRKKNLSFN